MPEHMDSFISSLILSLNERLPDGVEVRVVNVQSAPGSAEVVIEVSDARPQRSR